MTARAPVPMRWWGWGERDVHIPSALTTLIRDELGVTGDVLARAPSLDAVEVPEPTLNGSVRTALTEAVGDAHVRTDHESRVRHAAGRSYIDLMRLRSGKLDIAPDAVVFPANPGEVAAIIRACVEHACAAVPFGGGTSVVGGVAPLRGDRDSVITIDLTQSDAAANVDTVALQATFSAGMRGPAVEAVLAPLRLTMGHFPQSFEYATVGGFAAARSAGQASTGFGRFDEIARGLRMTTPCGELAVTPFPATAAGPSLLQLALGSEGTLGVITEVTVRVRERPTFKRYAGWSLESLEAGLATLRDLAQHDHLPDVARLSDEEETRVSFALAGSGPIATAAHGYLRLRGHDRGGMLVLGWEGDAASVGTRERFAASVLRRHGAVALGAAPGRAWLRGRFEAPYLRDALLDRGVVAETLETAASWSRIHHVHGAGVAALRQALAVAAMNPLVGCHVSHVYRDGASLYFTVLARQESGREIAQWEAAKQAATAAILEAGGTLTHHHGVGVDHAPWMEREAGTTGTRALRSLQAGLDPSGVMNPGKLTVTRSAAVAGGRKL